MLINTMSQKSLGKLAVATLQTYHFHETDSGFLPWRQLSFVFVKLLKNVK